MITEDVSVLSQNEILLLEPQSATTLSLSDFAEKKFYQIFRLRWSLHFGGSLPFREEHDHLKFMVEDEVL